MGRFVKKLFSTLKPSHKTAVLWDRNILYLNWFLKFK